MPLDFDPIEVVKLTEPANAELLRVKVRPKIARAVCYQTLFCSSHAVQVLRSLLAGDSDRVKWTGVGRPFGDYLQDDGPA